MSDVRPGPPHGGILMATFILAASGLVMVYSATAPLALERTVPPHFIRQLGAVLAGAAIAAICMLMPLRIWQRLALPLWALSIALLVTTLVGGERVNGGRRWLSVPGLGFRFQPGEIAKWATLLAMAALLAGPSDQARDGRPSHRTARGSRAGARGGGLRALLSRVRNRGVSSPLAARPRAPERRNALPNESRRLPTALLASAFALAALPAGLLFFQPDTGSAALLLGLAGALLFVAGTPLRAFLAPAVLGVAGIGVAVLLRPYVLARIRAVWDPWALAQAEGFQLVQSFVAFGRGGAFGVGLGDGRQKLYYLPEAHTDFVLSVVAEEAGLLGVSVVLGAFTAVLVAGCRIAMRAPSRFALLLAFGMTAFLTLPAALNAAVVMGLVPPTGLTLPFLSYGRTSIIMCFVAVGILLGIARRQPPSPAPTRSGAAMAPAMWRL